LEPSDDTAVDTNDGGSIFGAQTSPFSSSASPVVFGSPAASQSIFGNVASTQPVFGSPGSFARSQQSSMDQSEITFGIPKSPPTQSVFGQPTFGQTASIFGSKFQGSPSNTMSGMRNNTISTDYTMDDESVSTTPRKSPFRNVNQSSPMSMALSTPQSNKVCDFLINYNSLTRQNQQHSNL
jgi:hypothetical protein